MTRLSYGLLCGSFDYIGYNSCTPAHDIFRIDLNHVLFVATAATDAANNKDSVMRTRADLDST